MGKCNEETGECEDARHGGPWISGHGNYSRWIPGMPRDHPACEAPPGCCCDSCYPCPDHVIAKAIRRRLFSQKKGSRIICGYEEEDFKRLCKDQFTKELCPE